MVTGMTAHALAIAMLLAARPAPAPAPASKPAWLGDELPLPLAVRTPDDLAFKALTERQYLVFNLLAEGKLAWDSGDYPKAAARWEALLKLPGSRRRSSRACDRSRWKRGSAPVVRPRQPRRWPPPASP